MSDALASGNRHSAVGAWFLGPRAENFPYLKEVLNIVLDQQEIARKNYFPSDQNFITPEMQDTTEFKTQINKLRKAVNDLAGRLAQHSVPFWSQRYNAHMNMDTSMPGIAGYLAAMLFNPNNRDVGLELAEMVGFNRYARSDAPGAWGHITCGGSVANLEAVWAARNLKFYPLSLRLAMKPGHPLNFIARNFQLPTCTGQVKLLRDFTTWELLNIIPEVTLDIPDLLYNQYKITPRFLQKVLREYLVQTASKDSDIFQEFGRQQTNSMGLVTSATKHYSWPKAAAVTGVGSANIIEVQVDDAARMDMADLRRCLDQCLTANPPRAIYAVVAITGSTEHGACDPLDKMVKLRDEYRKKGLSFILHADGAWGAYFASMIPHGLRDLPNVPSLALKPSTLSALKALRYCDSVTVDPHKSGYVQYPAGGLLYRDGRMRYQVTWTSPIVFRDTDLESMGVYGIEGSKPGAAPVAIWLSHQVIGLNPEGYGELLGEALFSCAKLYSHLATMSDASTDFIVTPLNMLPAEASGQDVEKQKNFIRTHILNIPNEELKKDLDAMELIHEIGSDFAINAFAVNFKVNGKVNEDVTEANDLNKRIFQRLSIVDDKTDINTIPLVLTSTQLAQAAYTTCLDTFKRRLGLVGQQDLYTLVNVVMSPFPTTHNFTAEIASQLQTVIEEEVWHSQHRNTIGPDLHGFIIQGTDKLHLVHLPMFSMANHRYQLIITGDIPVDVMAKYVQERQSKPNQYFTLGTARREVLEEILAQGSFDAVIDIGFPPEDRSHFLTGFKLTNIQVILNRSLNSKDLHTTYPSSTMPFFLYGTKDQVHIDHALLASPNIQLNSDQIQLDGPPLPRLTFPLVAHFQDTPEDAMQTFPKNAIIESDKTFFFRPGQTFEVVITSDLDGANPVWTGRLTLGNTVFSDTDLLNMSPHYPEQLRGAQEHPDDAPIQGSYEVYGKASTVEGSRVPLLKQEGAPRGQSYIDIINELKPKSNEDGQQALGQRMSPVKKIHKPACRLSLVNHNIRKMIILEVIFDC